MTIIKTDLTEDTTNLLLFQLGDSVNPARFVYVIKEAVSAGTAK
jgi:hypothetical protein